MKNQKMFLFVTLLFFAFAAHADIRSGVNEGISWLQGILLAACSLGFIMAGLKYLKGDQQSAVAYIVGTVLAIGLIAGGPALTTMVKGWFGY